LLPPRRDEAGLSEGLNCMIPFRALLLLGVLPLPLVHALAGAVAGS
jgi:hypothetical protein